MLRQADAASRNAEFEADLDHQERAVQKLVASGHWTKEQAESMVSQKLAMREARKADEEKSTSTIKRVAPTMSSMNLSRIGSAEVVAYFASKLPKEVTLEQEAVEEAASSEIQVSSGLGIKEGTVGLKDHNTIMSYYQGSGEFNIFDRNTGNITSSTGYSGVGAGLNNSEMQHVADVGHIPTGTWIVGGYGIQSDNIGRLAIPLTPSYGNNMAGRPGGFFIHGDNSARNYTASEGCIIHSYEMRKRIVQAGGGILYVR